jgi:hypothetical protein
MPSIARHGRVLALRFQFGLARGGSLTGGAHRHKRHETTNCDIEYTTLWKSQAIARVGPSGRAVSSRSVSYPVWVWT